MTLLLYLFEQPISDHKTSTTESYFCSSIVHSRAISFREPGLNQHRHSAVNGLDCTCKIIAYHNSAV